MMPNRVSDRYPLHLNRRIYDWIFRHVGIKPIANSHYTLGTLGPSKARRYVMHLGVDATQFDPAKWNDGADVRRSLRLPDDAVLLGVFARMVRYKGQEVLIRSLSELSVADLHVMFCGGPLGTAYTDELKRLVDDCGLTGRVHFLGNVSNPSQFYAACDVVANPHVQAEGFGISVIEAMMMARPVLAGALGGPAETISDGLTGWLVEEVSVTGYLKGLRRMLADRARWVEMGRAARTHAVENFSSSAMVDRLLAIITLERSRSAASGSGQAQ
jgi:glycosyltransferase involved in cell wall biosynthesis